MCPNETQWLVLSQSSTTMQSFMEDTEALRRSAELTMHSIVRIVFSRLHTLDPEVEEKKLIPAQDGSAKDLAITPTVQTGETSSTLPQDLIPSQQPEGPPQVAELSGTHGEHTPRMGCRSFLLV